MKRNAGMGNINACSYFINAARYLFWLFPIFLICSIYHLYTHTGYEGDSSFMVSRDVNYDLTRSYHPNNQFISILLYLTTHKYSS